jgi:hypothetical protein
VRYLHKIHIESKGIIARIVSGISKTFMPVFIQSFAPLVDDIESPKRRLIGLLLLMLGHRQSSWFVVHRFTSGATDLSQKRAVLLIGVYTAFKTFFDVSLITPFVEIENLNFVKIIT